MDSEDSHDGSRDARSSSSSSSSSSRNRRSSSSDRSDSVKIKSKSPRQLIRVQGPRSPSLESHSQSPSGQSTGKPVHSPDMSGAHSDINSPESSMPDTMTGLKSPDAPKSPSDTGSRAESPTYTQQYTEEYPTPSGGTGPKTPQSPISSVRSNQNSPEHISRISSSPRNRARESSTSPSSGRNSCQSSPTHSPPTKKNQWTPKEKWRRHTKAERKMVTVQQSRSRSNSSTSSRSSVGNKIQDPATEEISEGEMESDQEHRKPRSKATSSEKKDGRDLNLSHEDLSDVSDLDSVGAEEPDSKEKSPLPSPGRKVEVTMNGIKTQPSPKSDSEKVDIQNKLDKVPHEKTCNTEDCEEQLDFEAEEGECVEQKAAEHSNGQQEDIGREEVKPGRSSRGSSLEEGEVSDEAERRPEENEPRPICRFFSRGACTWGVSCRFLHPGVTDKGNYNMFEVIRGVPAAPTRDLAPPESAWERGLRTAKEMLRKANKRKEQDMDFEEKKLHLSVGGVVHDPDAELAYAAAAVGASPPDHRGHHDLRVDHPEHHPDRAHLYQRDPEVYRTYGPMYRGRFSRPGGEERDRYYERERVYEQERPYERVPTHYEEPVGIPEDGSYHKRRVRSSREVIVQRAEVERRDAREVRESREVREGRDVRELKEVRGEGREGRIRDTREGRGDEWADPWMRSEPMARRRRPPSSDDSYSSSSSNSSSRSSRSPGARHKRRASSSSKQRLSPSVIVRERRMASARATAMNPPAPRRRAPSPAAVRQSAANPPAPAHTVLSHRHKEEVDPYGRTVTSRRSRDRKKYSRSSSSGSESSSSSSGSESESRSSSTSGSSGARRARHARLINASARPRFNTKSGGGGGAPAASSTAANKKEVQNEKEIIGKKRAATSPINSTSAKKSASRREELLKQLKAVEDAIARKRSKI